MSLTLEPVRVATDYDEEGMLVFDGNRRLVAVLTHLSEQNDVASGRWFLEVGFGRLGMIDHPTFGSLDAAQDWISQRLGKPA